MKNKYMAYFSILLFSLLLLFTLLLTEASCASVPSQQEEAPSDTSVTADAPPVASQQPEEIAAPAVEIKPDIEPDLSKAASPAILPERVMDSPPKVSSPPPLPAKYRVRPYPTYKDTLRNIAARPWVYNDPTKWRVLYNANKSKLPQPNNPNLIYPGMILDIPSIKGELRRGIWDPKVKYQPLKK